MIRGKEQGYEIVKDSILLEITHPQPFLLEFGRIRKSILEITGGHVSPVPFQFRRY